MCLVWTLTLGEWSNQLHWYHLTVSPQKLKFVVWFMIHDGVTLRPLRLLPIGTKVAIREAVRQFLNYALINDLPIVYHQPCPKLGHSASRERYLMYMHASTLRQARELGAFMEDIKWDYSNGFIKFPTHESILPGPIS